MTVKFVFDPEFDENVRKASSKSKSSLRGIFNLVRAVTDEVYIHARESIAREAGRAEGEAQSVRAKRFSRTGRANFAYYKAKANALRTARNTIAPTMEFDGKEIFGRVMIYRKSSAVIEFGGLDPVAEIGRGTGEYVEHPPYAFLRKALDSAGG